MKLRKQAPAKAVIAATTAGLLFAFYSVVKAEPRIAAEPEPAAPVNYDRFFAPAASSTPRPDVYLPSNPDGRTRGS